MKWPHLKRVFKQNLAILHKGRYAMLRSKEKVLGKHFLVAHDKDEITIITEEK